MTPQGPPCSLPEVAAAMKAAGRPCTIRIGGMCDPLPHKLCQHCMEPYMLGALPLPAPKGAPNDTQDNKACGAGTGRYRNNPA